MTSADALGSDVTWRVNRWLIWTCRLLGVVLLAIDVAAFKEGDFGAGMLGLGLVFGFTVLVDRPKVTVRGDVLLVQGFILHRQVALEDVEDVLPGYGGLNICLTGDRMVQTSLVGEKSNFYTAIGRRGQSDRLSEEILERATRARSRAPRQD